MVPETIPADEPVEGLVITQSLTIPHSELSFRYSRSGGPGGQHVNRTESRVEVLFDVANSPSLSESQRSRLLVRLANRIDQAGVLHVVSSHTRSQVENRQDALARLRTLLQRGLQRRTARIATRPSAAARERRLAQKKRRAERKRTRGRVDPRGD